jgi:hypothetical protein
VSRPARPRFCAAVLGSAAQAETYTIAHHLFSEEGKPKIMVASLRYLDALVKLEQRWYFAERELIVDWAETRSRGDSEGR